MLSNHLQNAGIGDNVILRFDRDHVVRSLSPELIFAGLDQEHAGQGPLLVFDTGAKPKVSSCRSVKAYSPF
ncbi:hypothetical protein [Rufibacter immobilis]|uniref:hypothetical protein n=1 Tax=Rufibacter immobilis TaxID=1348778 RepID=UPI00366AB13C